MTTEEKKRLFDQNQNNFIFKKDIIAGIVKTENGPKMILNIEKRSELTHSLGELQIAILSAVIKADAVGNVKGIMGIRRM